MKFTDDDWRFGRHKSSDVAQDFGRIVSVVQNHCNQGRVHLHIIGPQRRCVRSNPLNLSDPTLLLATLKLR